MTHPEIITDDSRLRAVVGSALKYPSAALDLESNGFHRYPERICLVQLAFADGIYLIDPLAVDDLAPLGEILSSPLVEKIFHSADYDIRSLDRDWSFPVSPLFDTSIAAAFVGYSSLGLASLLKESFDVEISKSKRLQRADWTVRPISEELEAYAAEDVRHLHRLADVLRKRLGRLGRAEWVKEECERLSRVRYSHPDRGSGFFSLKGNRDLDGAGLAILRSLYRFREREALQRDRPPFKVFSNAAMLELAFRPESDLRSVSGLGNFAFGRNAHRLRGALREGVNSEPVERPRLRTAKRERVSAVERQSRRRRLGALKDWRREHAHRLGLGVGLVWSAASLERISIDPSNFSEELTDQSIRHWQRSELADSLATLVKGM